jgi:hypothetical protein
VAKDGELADKVWMPDHTDPTDLAAGDNESPDAAEQAAVGHTDPPPSPQPEEEEVSDATVPLRVVPLFVRPPAASASASRGPAAFIICAQGAEEDHRPGRGCAEEAAPDGVKAGSGSSRVSFFSPA